MEEIISCPPPEHVRRASRIKREVDRVAFAASWPSSAVTAGMSFLAAGVSLVARSPREDFPLILFFLVYVAVTPEQSVADRILRLRKGICLIGPSFITMKLSWWNHLLSAAASVLLAFLLVPEGTDRPVYPLVAFWLYLGVASLLDGWERKRWDRIFWGVFFLGFGVIFAHLFSEGGNIGEEFFFVFMAGGVAEAGLAYRARREWKKDSARLESVLA